MEWQETTLASLSWATQPTPGVLAQEAQYSKTEVSPQDHTFIVYLQSCQLLKCGDEKAIIQKSIQHSLPGARGHLIKPSEQTEDPLLFPYPLLRQLMPLAQVSKAAQETKAADSWISCLSLLGQRLGQRLE